MAGDKKKKKKAQDESQGGTLEFEVLEEGPLGDSHQEQH